MTDMNKETKPLTEEEKAFLKMNDEEFSKLPIEAQKEAWTKPFDAEHYLERSIVRCRNTVEFEACVGVIEVAMRDTRDYWRERCLEIARGIIDDAELWHIKGLSKEEYITQLEDKLKQ